MRVAVLAMGSRGDVWPYLALGLGLKEAGHEVRFAAYTNFEQEVCARGLDYEPILGDYYEIVSGELGVQLAEEEPGKRRVKMEEAGQNPLLLARHVLSTMNPLAKKSFADALEVCRGADAILCSAIGFFSGYHVAELLGIPCVPAFLQHVHPTRELPCMGFPEAPGWLPEGSPLRAGYNLSTYWLAEKSLILLRNTTNRARRGILGLPPMRGRDSFGAMVRDRNPCLYGFSPQVLPKPHDWGGHLRVTGYWSLQRPDDFKPPKALEDFLSAGPPPVSIGFGSMNERDPEETTEVVLEALRLSGRRGILLTGWGGLSNPDLPEGIFKAEEVPHDWLFPHISVAVHHGGAGTTAASLRAGVPTAIVPFIGDQPMWGRRVHALGAGPAPIPRKRLCAERLAEAIKAAEEPEVRERARALGERLRREDGVREAVDAFVQAAHTHRR
ncbi:glycosyltransferase [Rubrobacter aplysinae]|uniref:glycosyltransferase n=1 Tax=Rubrobacter aplysinae TaxID=909625 RepID=UPI00064C4767|nr:glycosyltransferase [Rubrobacter aplysinae]